MNGVSGVVVLWIALGGALGAVARAALAHWLSATQPGGLPLGTLAANVVASFLIVFFADLTSGEVNLFLVTGLCGALSTYSTFSLETVRLRRGERPQTAWLYVALTLLGTFSASVCATVVVGLLR